MSKLLTAVTFIFLAVIMYTANAEEAKDAQKCSTDAIVIANPTYINNLVKAYKQDKGFPGKGAGQIWDFAKLDFDNGYTLKAPGTNKKVKVALFYITVKVKIDACPPEITKFWNYTQMPVLLVNYACNVTGFDSQGVLQTTAGDVNTHFYYAVKDPSFKNKTKASMAVFTLWPGMEIKIHQIKPNMMFQKKSDGNYYIKVKTHKFKVNEPAPPGTPRYRMLVPYQS
ncbi:MAG: hypothetical protein GY750_01535 [Lentisphaerae bacterium]|nr:hypothetical protein [Lentisphaerota bacterium]MCP4100102.1 hypothetical protein [Lentisphaerota bacterium]